MNAVAEVVKAPSKMSRAIKLYEEIHTPGYKLDGKTQRAVFIERSQKECDLTKNGAGTYYQNISDNKNHGKGLYHRNKPAKKKPTKADVKSAEASVLLALPHLEAHRWMAINDQGVEVHNFKTRGEAQNYAKDHGFKWADRTKAA